MVPSCSHEVNSFTFDGRALRLIVQSGIWKPAGLDAATSIRTTFTRPAQSPHYEDDVGAARPVVRGKCQRGGWLS
jgi:hypothetical protein